MTVYRTRRAPNPRGIRSDPILRWVGVMVLTYIIAATVWTLLAVALTPVAATLLLIAACVTGIGALVVRATDLDRRDAAKHLATPADPTNEEAPDGHTAPGQES